VVGLKLMQLYFFGLSISYFFNHIYHDLEVLQPKLPHALKRNQITHYFWGLFHCTLCFSIVTMALGLRGLAELNIYDLEKNFQLNQLISNYSNITLYPNTNYSQEQIQNLTDFFQNESYVYCCDPNDPDNRITHFSKLFCFGTISMVFCMSVFEWLSMRTNRKFYFKILNQKRVNLQILATFYRFVIIIFITSLYFIRAFLNPIALVTIVAVWFIIWSIIEAVFTMDEQKHKIENFEELEKEREEYIHKANVQIGIRKLAKQFEKEAHLEGKHNSKIDEYYYELL